MQKITVNSKNKTTIISQLNNLKNAYYIGKLNTVSKKWDEDYNNNKVKITDLENNTVVKFYDNKGLIIISNKNIRIELLKAAGSIIDSKASIYKQSILIDKNSYNFSMNDILDNIRLL